MIGEELEGMYLVVLLTHEQQWRRGRREDAKCGEPELYAVQAIAESTVADLIVILRADDEVFTLWARERPGDVLERSVILVVALALTGQHRMHGVVEFVGPLRVMAPFRDRSEVAGLHLRDDEDAFGSSSWTAIGELF